MAQEPFCLENTSGIINGIKHGEMTLTEVMSALNSITKSFYDERIVALQDRVFELENNPNSQGLRLKSIDMNFGQAIEALKAGRKVAREGWNGKAMFLILNGGYSLKKEDCFDTHINVNFLTSEGQSHLNISRHIDMWTDQKTLCIGWLASQTDMLAEDWLIVE